MIKTPGIVQKEYTIYYLMNKVDGKIFYVGMTEKPLYQRLGGHVSESKTGYSNKEKGAIIKAAGKNGITIHEIETIVCEKAAACNRELFWIAQFVRHEYKITNKFTNYPYHNLIYDNKKNKITRVGSISVPFMQFIYQSVKLISEV